MAMDLSSGLITCDACHEQVEGFRPVKHYLLHYSAYLDLILQRLRSTPILCGQLTRLDAVLDNSRGQQQAEHLPARFCDVDLVLDEIGGHLDVPAAGVRGEGSPFRQTTTTAAVQFGNIRIDVGDAHTSTVG